MNVSTSPQLYDLTNLGERLIDLGDLTVCEAIRAMSRHNDCASQCVVPQQVMHAVGVEFIAVARSLDPTNRHLGRRNELCPA
ncbi:hypothetical protein [Nocardia sp. NPDC052112]|uniref:hypothetical protein n=1 Tax=Nocardia sp. NPDC052112 TaxID=3155646 RepID=UPI0034150F98